MNIYETRARERVSNNETLNEYASEIWYDWPNWDEHVEWIAQAPVDEIIGWAQSVRKDAQD